MSSSPTKMNSNLAERIQNHITRNDLSIAERRVKPKNGLGWKSKITLILLPTIVALITTTLFILSLLGYIQTGAFGGKIEKIVKNDDILLSDSPHPTENPLSPRSKFLNSRSPSSKLSPSSEDRIPEDEEDVPVDNAAPPQQGVSSAPPVTMPTHQQRPLVTTNRNRRGAKKARRKKRRRKKSDPGGCGGGRERRHDLDGADDCDEEDAEATSTKMERNRNGRAPNSEGRKRGTNKNNRSSNHYVVTSQPTEAAMTSQQHNYSNNDDVATTSSMTDMDMSCTEIEDQTCRTLLSYSISPDFRTTGFTDMWARAAAVTSVIARALSSGAREELDEEEEEEGLDGGLKKSCDVIEAERFSCSLRYPQCEASTFDGHVITKLPCKHWCVRLLNSCLSQQLLDELDQLNRRRESSSSVASLKSVSRNPTQDQTLIARVCDEITSTNPDQSQTSSFISPPCVENHVSTETGKNGDRWNSTVGRSGGCESDQFQCNDGRCIDTRWRCDANKDCSEWEDEKNCECRYDQYQCASGQCIHIERECDGFRDCFDSSDENNCGTCKEGLTSCGDGQCVLDQWWCDGDLDCQNGQDESRCSCESQGFSSCHSGSCVSAQYVCDGKIDCDDGSDEISCQSDQSESECKLWEIPCGNECISVVHRCDGSFNCSDKSDESKCGRVEQVKMKICADAGFRLIYGPNFLGHRSQEETVLSQEFSIFTAISHTRCHPFINHLSCSIFAPYPGNQLAKRSRFSQEGENQVSKSLPCRSLCEDVRSMCSPLLRAASMSWPHFLQCESFPEEDCLDENSFKSDICPFSQLSCPGNNTRCIGENARCDGFVDCEQGTDEAGCNCDHLRRFRCRADNKCISKDWVCDTHMDCSDGSDEVNCGQCSDDTRMCDDYKCLLRHKWCDGVNDCKDGSDEKDCLRLAPTPSAFLNSNDIIDNNPPLVGDEEQTVTSGYLIGYDSSNQRWAPLCYGGWNERISHLACRQIDLGKAISYATVAHHEDQHLNLPHLPLNIDLYRKMDKLQRFFDHSSADCNYQRYLKLECNSLQCGRRYYDDVTATSSRGSGVAMMGGNIRRRLTKRILNGRTSRDRAWPWLASLRLRGVGHVCGATLLKSDWLVSAAHCFQEREQPQVWNVVIRNTKNNAIDEMTFNISHIYIHPRFEPTTVDFDIAMIKLSRPINKKSAHPICLPKTKLDLNRGSFCMIAGWGLTGQMLKSSNKLREGSVHVIDRYRCQHLYPYHRITGRMICAGRAGIVDTCNGDSGGPLMCWNSNSQRWQLAGITSWGSACKTNSAPGVYTDVSYFTDWMRTQINTQKR